MLRAMNGLIRVIVGLRRKGCREKAKDVFLLILLDIFAEEIGCNWILSIPPDRLDKQA
jgi:hypothetical protein